MFQQTVIDLVGHVPEQFKDDQDQEPWTIVFDRRRPITTIFAQDMFRVTIRGVKYYRGSRAYPAMNVTVTYKLEKAGQTFKAVRQGELAMFPPDFVPGTSKLSGQQIAIRTILQRKLGKALKPELVPQGFTLGGRWAAAGKFLPVQISCRDGWLVIGWRRAAPPPAATAAALRTGRRITSRLRGGQSHFRWGENWDSPRLICRPVLSRLLHIPIPTRIASEATGGAGGTPRIQPRATALVPGHHAQVWSPRRLARRLPPWAAFSLREHRRRIRCGCSPCSPLPAMEDVRQLLDEIARRQSELEQQNEQLRKTQQQLEAYRDRYVNLYDFAPLGYATFDKDGFVQEINLAGAKLLARDRDALTGYAFTDYVAEEDRQAFLEHLGQCAGQRREVTSELRLVSAGGQAIAAQFHSIPIAGQTDDVLCKTAITDITRRRSAEEALQQERNLLRTLIDNLPDYISIKDCDGRFLAANLAAAQSMGVATPDDLLGKTDADFCPPELAAEYRADEQELLRTGQPLVNKQESRPDATGKLRTILTTKIPLKDPRGKLCGLVAISRDITERR